MRCNNAVSRSVPLPLSWRTAIKVVAAVDRMRREAIAEASRQIENPQCDCRLFGIPKSGADLDELCSTAGTVVWLKCQQGTRQPFLLCARVSGDVWICHPGTLLDSGALCSDNPFDIKDLAVRDVVADRFERDALPRRRIAPHTNVNLQEAAAANPNEWSHVRAIAL